MGHPAFVARVAESYGGASPVFFGPGTLWRTWGTRPVPIRTGLQAVRKCLQRIRPLKGLI
jgi:hypothetical protein